MIFLTLYIRVNVEGCDFIESSAVVHVCDELGRAGLEDVEQGLEWYMDKLILLPDILHKFRVLLLDVLDLLPNEGPPRLEVALEWQIVSTYLLTFYSLLVLHLSCFKLLLVELVEVEVAFLPLSVKTRQWNVESIADSDIFEWQNSILVLGFDGRW